MSNRSDTAEDSIVIPRSCSSSLESRNRSFPAIRDEMILLDESSESAKEVLPWSTWATIVTFWSSAHARRVAVELTRVLANEASNELDIVLRL